MANRIFRAIAWPLVIGLHLLACLLLLLWLVLGTDYGTQQGFAAAARWLPLSYDSVNGNALNRLEIQGLRYQNDNLEFSAEQLQWSLTLASLWQAEPRLHIQTITINNAVINLKQNKAEADNQTAAEPFALSDVQLPLAIQVDALTLGNIQLQQAGQHYALEQLTAEASVNQQGQIQLGTEIINGPFNSQAKLSLAAQMTADTATAELTIDHATAMFEQRPIQASGESLFTYDGDRLRLNAENLQASYDSAQLTINGELSPGETLLFQLELPNLAIANPDLAGSANISGKIENAEQLQAEGVLDQLSWLGEPQLQRATFNWQGTLAEQRFRSSLLSHYWGLQTLEIDSQFGWRGNLASLQHASSLSPEQLLAAKPLHFRSTIKLAEAEIAASGVNLKNNQLDLTLLETGELSINGSSQSGSGEAAVIGTLQLLDSAKQDIAVSAKLTGQQYRLANTPELVLSASPNIDIKLAQQQLTVRGDIAVDNGHIEIILPEASAISASDDVVFVDETLAVEPSSPALQRDVQLTLSIKNPLTIKGQGFDGSATGQLTVTESHGQSPRARGELLLAGRYKAYGQDLSIRRGKLIYVDSPIDDPGVDLEAIRSVGEQIAGVRVSGLASNPKISIFAEPALSETEALSYLILGRGLDKNSERDQNQLRNLALSLGLSKGGKFLEKSKDKLGVDELSIQTGNSNNDASLLVGRQLSKRLYLSTQIGLFEPVTKLLLRYTLSRKCDFVAETGSQQGADLVCTITSGP